MKWMVNEVLKKVVNELVKKVINQVVITIIQWFLVLSFLVDVPWHCFIECAPGHTRPCKHP
jgi:hypothetical protein